MNKRHKQHLSIAPGSGLAATVVNNDINFALKNWKREVKNSGILNEYRERQEYVKPSVKRRAEINRAKYIQKIRTENFD